MPSTPAGIFLDARAATAGEGGQPGDVTDPGSIGGAFNIAANSGNSQRYFHPLAPSASTLVWALARPSAIHWRNRSAVTGPYSLPSAPTTLYIMVILDALYPTLRISDGYRCVVGGLGWRSCFIHSPKSWATAASMSCAE